MDEPLIGPASWMSDPAEALQLETLLARYLGLEAEQVTLVGCSTDAILPWMLDENDPTIPQATVTFAVVIER